LKVKLDLYNANVGIFSINAQRGGHDRHIGIKNGRPYYRTWTGSGYYGDFHGIDVFDGNFHQWELIARNGQGQKAYIDGVEVASHAYDHSDFYWKN